ncbi:NADPH-dependent FMN reductase [Aureimonas psammosilenae]|uniref:NADPH-dependent FMN reductase n=1 Tax=Aureimonas psammosilenae TaxID=2495496 RepID=UPI001260F5F8|nr:NAD(P)H-dependent oxidoreductase [Aureimonas psammosilenae]
MPAISRILVLVATSKAGSPSGVLAFEIARRLAVDNADVAVVSLEDYPLPLLDTEAPAPVPLRAAKLCAHLTLQDALVLVSPPANGSLAPLAKNAVDWIAKAGGDGAKAADPFRGLVVAVAATTDGEEEAAHAALEAWNPVFAALGTLSPQTPLAVDAARLRLSAETPDEELANALDGFARSIAARVANEGRRNA